MFTANVYALLRRALEHSRRKSACPLRSVGILKRTARILEHIYFAHAAEIDQKVSPQN